MTENKAIEWLRAISATQSSSSHSASLQDRKEALYMAIQALEAIQAYRAIGTVEEIEATIKNLNKVLLEHKDKLAPYVNIGTIDEFKALKEKNEPKQPIRSDLCTCPSCGTHNEIIKKRRNTVAFDTVYCWHCGQAVEIKRN